MIASTEIRGLMRDGQSRLRVVVDCGRNRHHRYIGNDGSVLARPEIK